MQSLSGLPDLYMTSWLNAHSIIKVFYFSTIFVKGFSGLGEDLVFNYIDHLTCLLRNPYAGQEATVRIGHGSKNRLVPNRKRITSRLYIVTLLI